MQTIRVSLFGTKFAASRNNLVHPLRGRRLTAFYKPQGDVLTPHVSYDDGRKPSFFHVPVKALEAFAARYGAMAQERFNSQIVLTTREKLEAKGWLGIDVPDDVALKFFKGLRRRDGYHYINKTTCIEFGLLVFDHVVPLDALKYDGRPKSIIRPLPDDDFEVQHVYISPDGTWRTLTHDWMPKEALREFFIRELPRSFWVKMRTLFWLLRKDTSEIDRVLAEL